MVLLSVTSLHYRCSCGLVLGEMDGTTARAKIRAYSHFSSSIAARAFFMNSALGLLIP